MLPLFLHPFRLQAMAFCMGCQLLHSSPCYLTLRPQRGAGLSAPLPVQAPPGGEQAAGTPCR